MEYEYQKQLQPECEYLQPECEYLQPECEYLQPECEYDKYLLPCDVAMYRESASLSAALAVADNLVSCQEMSNVEQGRSKCRNVEFAHLLPPSEYLDIIDENDTYHDLDAFDNVYGDQQQPASENINNNNSVQRTMEQTEANNTYNIADTCNPNIDNTEMNDSSRSLDQHAEGHYDTIDDMDTGFELMNPRSMDEHLEQAAAYSVIDNCTIDIQGGLYSSSSPSTTIAPENHGRKFARWLAAEALVITIGIVAMTVAVAAHYSFATSRTAITKSATTTSKHVIFQAYSSKPEAPRSAEPICFANVSVNIGEAYDSPSGKFVVPTSGLYWLFIGINSNAEGRADYSIRYSHTTQRTGLLGCNNRKLVRTWSRDDLKYLQAGTQVYVSSKYLPSAHDNEKFAITWAAFSIDNLFDEQQQSAVAFSVLNKDTTVIFYNPIPFSDVVVNVGNGWKSQQHVFSAPLGGIYFFSYSVAASSDSTFEVALRINHTSSDHFLFFEPSTDCEKRLLTASRSSIVKLAEGELASLVKHFGPTIENNPQYETTSFKGFLLCNVHQLGAVVWFLQANQTSETSEHKLFFVFGNKTSNSNIKFGINFAGGVNESQQLTVAVSGIYYVKMATFFCVQPVNCCTVTLTLNGTIVLMTVTSPSAQCLTQERSLLYPLESASDRLSVELLQGNVVECMALACWVQLSGFLIMPSRLG